ncbi:efflux RND transporter permease subunit [Trinickia caryophylli]|uniref:Multidrug efflux pump n=1 Tax=Trinickia caryophylli TaxID=28094 RepID=A0A1X7FVX2_TRICW|nr:efflux RND transporter permease subunit [Trinickia caryophylli]PMS11848.1 multidrug transporter subunit MdtC [Trinickia caryophylli]TRX17494.1 multidrug transporter subunit MdtC [Trinickia caryophylli]WQE11760.1 efflux RND transporter permease subunit [Trinickia caryophylli]SMF59660.1 multidrug efflux pump [Trinickia caryophylli]GLU34742.1 multidrug resistance protein MdtC [Trinickia caryophylli]
MNLCAPFIRRPIGTLLFAIGVALFGIVAYRLLPVAALPSVDFPVIMVSAQLAGADADTVAKTVTAPLERAFGSIAGLEQVTSQSSQGSSQIVLQFDLDRDIDGAVRDVQAAINAARSALPTDMTQTPTYRKFNPSAMPVMILSLTSDTMTVPRMYDYASSVLQQKLLQTPGVGDVTVGGGASPAVRMELNPDQLSHYGVSLEAVRTAIVDANANAPKGALSAGGQHYVIGANDQMMTAAGYASLVVRAHEGTIVRVSDVGHVVESSTDLRNYGLSNGKQAVLLIVSKEPNGNVIEMVDAIRQTLPALQASLPAGVRLGVVLDGTQTIRASIADVEISLLAAVVLVTIVSYVFFRDWRSTLVPAITVPLALGGTFAVMYFLGFSLNNLTLMALTISTGFVVDDAIVVVENIMRHLDEGKSPLEAALDGAREVGFTVLTISVSLVVVFTPLIFMSGIVGRLFREFSISLAVAILMSMIVSLTLAPTLCRLLLKREPSGAAHANRAEEALKRAYGRTLRWGLRHPRLMLTLTIGLVFANAGVAALMPKTFFPSQDTGRLMGQLQAAQTISFQAMKTKFDEFNRRVLANPDVAAVSGYVGGRNAISSSMIFVTLKPLSQRTHTAEQVIADIDRRTADIPGAHLYLQSSQDLMFGARQSAAQFQYTVKAEDQAVLDTWVPRILARFRSLPQLRDVNTDVQGASLSTKVDIDRDTAARLQVAVSSIDDTLNDAFSQRQIATLYGPANQYYVVMEVAPRYWQDPKTLDTLYVPATAASASSSSSSSSSAGTTLVPLSALARRVPARTQTTVAHDGQFPAVTISYNLNEGVSMSDANEAIDRAVKSMNLPNAIVPSFAGASGQLGQSGGSELMLVLGALVAVYIALGILYENLVHPLTIISTLPSAGLGALLALHAFGFELSIIALIGIVLLIGIVKKNAIMLVDFAVSYEQAFGASAEDSIFNACMTRFRPITMTTIAAVLGAVPLVAGSGYGHELRQPLGVAIIGGLFVSQMITLYTTPVIYFWLDRLKRAKRGTEGIA